MKQIDLQKASKIVPLRDGSLLVLISHECLASEEDKCRNIFKTNSNGLIYWQVGSYIVMPSLSSFTGVELRQEEIWAFNFDGGVYRIDQDSGVILFSELAK